MLTVKPALISKKAVIVISMPYKASWRLLSSLSSACYLTGTQHVEMAAPTLVLYSLYKYIDNKLSGSALDASRGKFTTICVDMQKNHAIFTMTTEPTFSAVRKVLTVFSKNFTPGRVLPIYKKYAQLLNVKVDLDNFNHAVGEINHAIKSLETYITGTIRVPDGKLPALKQALDIAVVAAPKGVAAAASLLPHDAYTVSCGSKLEAVLLQQLLQSMQIESSICNGDLVPVLGASKWDTVKNKIDDARITRFVEQKLIKLGDKLPLVMQLLCAQSGCFTSAELCKLPDKYTTGMLVAMLKKHG